MVLIKQEINDEFPLVFTNISSSSDSSSSTDSSGIENLNNESFLEFLRMKGVQEREKNKRSIIANGAANIQEEGLVVLKKPRIVEEEDSNVVLPRGFLSRIVPVKPDEDDMAVIDVMPVSVYPPATAAESMQAIRPPVVRGCKQFWKAGDYEINVEGGDTISSSVGMDHLRVHPKFLHSNATSHKWALGAFAELLDNALDEVCNGATYVNADVLDSMKFNNKMLLVEDNGGGMTPDKMRQCMSLGYSAKSKIANTIGQYGNGFKTSTMRLGADVIVFSRCQGNDGQSPTQSIGMLSYSFLTGTGKEDIVVPMIHYEKRGQCWNKMARSSNDWNTNLATIVHWSPYASEEDLLKQFNFLKDHGTRIIIYNLWEDDEGLLELDFDTDPHDIQLRGVNRDEKNIQMSKQFPNSRHYLTYRHSLRSYASILYLRLPHNYRIILRGEDVQHHSIVNDMMLAKEMTYRPVPIQDGMPKDSNMVAGVTIGFVKDAKAHIDVQGFNVYHKNRLIKPFWRVWNAAGSDGRGVIGTVSCFEITQSSVLEANFVEPAHDKQGFERTIVLARLENRLLSIQKTYWSTNCQEVGYAARRRATVSPDKVSLGSQSHREKSTSGTSYGLRQCTTGPPAHESLVSKKENGQGSKPKSNVMINKRSRPVGSASEDESCHEASPCTGESEQDPTSNGRSKGLCSLEIANLRNDLQYEKDRRKLLETQLQEKERKLEEMDREQIALIEMIAAERDRRDLEEEKLRNSIRGASDTIAALIEKVRHLEGRKVVRVVCKEEK
ncbi:protein MICRORCHIDIA 7-like [Fagus crenata]